MADTSPHPQPAPEADERGSLRWFLRGEIETADRETDDRDLSPIMRAVAQGRRDAFRRALYLVEHDHPQPAPRTVSAAQVDAATAAACAEAGWDWQGVPEERVPWPHTVMRDIVLAALPALDVTVEAPRG